VAEDLPGVESRGRGKRHLHRIEIVEDLAVGRLIVGKVAEADVALPELGVQRVTPVGLVDDDAVEGAGRRPGGRVRQVENALDHRRDQRVLRLLSERPAVDEEKDPAKPLVLEEAIHQGNGGARLPRAGRHGN